MKRVLLRIGQSLLAAVCTTILVGTTINLGIGVCKFVDWLGCKIGPLLTVSIMLGLLVGAVVLGCTLISDRDNNVN